MRISVAATAIETGESIIFDSNKQTIERYLIMNSIVVSPPSALMAIARLRFGFQTNLEGSLQRHFDAASSDLPRTAATVHSSRHLDLRSTTSE